MGSPGGSDGTESTCNVGDLGSIPELGRSPGRGHGNPLQYSCLENSMDRGAWWATKSPWGHKELDTTAWLSTYVPEISVQSVQSLSRCLTLWDPTDCRISGFPEHHQLPELSQIHVHWVSDAIQPSHPLSSPSPLTFNLSQHQGLFK